MKIKGKIILSVVSFFLVAGLAAGILLLKPNTVNDVEKAPQNQHVSLYPYYDEFESYLTVESQKIEAGAIFLYGNPTDENAVPTLSKYILLNRSEINELAETLKEQKWVADALVDRTSFTFDAQIYYHGWIYVSIGQKIAYYDEHFCTLPDSLTEQLEEKFENAEIYKGSYKAGAEINTKFLSCTVIKEWDANNNADVYYLVPFDSEPMNSVVKKLQINRSCIWNYPRVSEGEKLTVEFIGAIQANEIAEIPQTVAYYTYDKDFKYTPVGAFETVRNLSFYGVESQTLERYDNAEGLPESLSQFGAEFFKEYSLFVKCFKTGSLGYDYAVLDINKHNGTLNIIVYDTSIAECRNSAIGYYTVAVGVKKEDIADCTAFTMRTASRNELYEDAEKVENGNPYFEGTVEMVYENSLLVVPYYSDPINNTANILTVSTDVVSTRPLPEFKEGDNIRVLYNGVVQESYPAHVPTVFTIYKIQ